LSRPTSLMTDSTSWTRTCAPGSGRERGQGRGAGKGRRGGGCRRGWAQPPASGASAALLRRAGAECRRTGSGGAEPRLSPECVWGGGNKKATTAFSYAPPGGAQQVCPAPRLSPSPSPGRTSRCLRRSWYRASGLATASGGARALYLRRPLHRRQLGVLLPLTGSLRHEPCNYTQVYVRVHRRQGRPAPPPGHGRAWGASAGAASRQQRQASRPHRRCTPALGW
jgi:hypothetical protein